MMNGCHAENVIGTLLQYFSTNKSLEQMKETFSTALHLTPARVLEIEGASSGDSWNASMASMPWNLISF